LNQAIRRCRTEADARAAKMPGWDAGHPNPSPRAKRPAVGPDQHTEFSVLVEIVAVASGLATFNA